MNFIGKEIVTLLPGTTGYPMQFAFTPCTAVNKNDGAIPYGATITAAAIQVQDKNGADITTATATPPTVSGAGLLVNTTLNHPPLAAKGNAKAYLLLTLSTTAVITKQWDGLWVG